MRGAVDQQFFIIVAAVRDLWHATIT